MKRILVLGTGSVGTVYAMLLSKGGADVTCVCRSNYTAARENGLLVRSTIFGEQLFRPTVARTVRDACENHSLPFDFVVVCMKAVQGQDAHFWQDLLSPAVRSTQTAIVVIQNGLGVEDVFHGACPHNTIVSGVTYLPTSQAIPGIVSHTETQRLHLGPFPAHTATDADRVFCEGFAELIRAAGGDATVHTDVQIERWKKLIGNATWNPICALSRRRDLEFLRASPDLAEAFVIDSMREVLAVADALGYGEHITAHSITTQMQRSRLRAWPGVEPSMLADVLNGKPMEVEVVIGNVVKAAKRSGVPVPRLETLYLLLKAFESTSS